MADYGDQSQAAGDIHLKASLARIERHRVADVEILDCTDCGHRIPKARRQAVPGCHLCVACQQLNERLI